MPQSTPWLAAVQGLVLVCIMRLASRMPSQEVQAFPYPSQLAPMKAPRPVHESWNQMIPVQSECASPMMVSNPYGR